MATKNLWVYIPSLEVCYDTDDLTWMINEIRCKPFAELSSRDLQFLLAIAEKYYQYMVSISEPKEEMYI